MTSRRAELKKQNSSQARSARPDVFSYHDYRVYLKDWLAYKKASQSDYSLRELAAASALSPSFLSMVVSGARKLTSKALFSLGPVLSLSEAEKDYLGLLLILGDSTSADERQDAYRRMTRMRPYRKVHPDEKKAYEYLSHWYYVAIREMAALPGFKAEAGWVRPRLRYDVSLKEIKQALDFLITNKFIEIAADGTVTPPEPSLDCEGGVYRLALGRFHDEMLSLASASIHSAASDERLILGYTLPVDRERFDEIHKLLNELHKKLGEIAKRNPSGEIVAHVELALFPLTKTKGVKKI